MNDFMKRHQEEQEYRAYMTRRIDELSHGNSSDCTTEEILQIASQLDDGERINCTAEITPNIELEVNISNRLQEDARVMLNWHTTDKGISRGITLSITTPFLPDETKNLMLVLGEYSEQRWRVTNGGSAKGKRLSIEGKKRPAVKQRYTIEIQETDGQFKATVPEIGATVTGTTENEAMIEAQRAIVGNIIAEHEKQKAEKERKQQ